MPYYCTLSVVKRQLSADSDIVDSEDDELFYYIDAASAAVEEYCGQNFDIRIMSQAFNGEIGKYEPKLYLDAQPLLSLTTILNGDSSVIASTNYDLLPKFKYPKEYVRLAQGTYWLAPNSSSDGTCSTPSPNRSYAEDAIELTGEWGYVPQYARAWRTITPTVSGAHNATTTTLNISAAAGVNNIDAGTVLKIGSEQMVVTAPLSTIATATALTVERGYNGTTAAALTGGEAITVFRVDRVVELATAMTASALYQARNNASGETIQGLGVTTVVAPKIPPKNARALLQEPYKNWKRGQA